jgi:hypothetical protein
MPRTSNPDDYGGGLSPVKLTDLTKHLGTVKNELLIFVVLIIIVTDIFAYALVRTQDTIPKICGACMGGSTVIMFFLSITLYVYAMFKLPGNKQQLMFQEEAEKTLKVHRRAKQRVKTPLNPQL